MHYAGNTFTKYNQCLTHIIHLVRISDKNTKNIFLFTKLEAEENYVIQLWGSKLFWKNSYLDLNSKDDSRSSPKAFIYINTSLLSVLKGMALPIAILIILN